MAIPGPRGEGEHDPEDLAVHTLADIIRGMQHGANSAQEIIEQQFPRLLHRYFKEGEHGLEPIMVRFKLPGGGVMDAPLISLVPVNTIKLDELTIHMAIRIDQTKTKAAGKRGTKNGLTRTSFQVSISPRKQNGEERDSSLVDVEMKFKPGDSPEGVSRVIEEYTKGLILHSPEDAGPTPEHVKSTGDGGESESSEP